VAKRFFKMALGITLLHVVVVSLLVIVADATEYDSQGLPSAGVRQSVYSGTRAAVLGLCWPGQETVALLSLSKGDLLLRVVVSAGNSLLFGAVLASLAIIHCDRMTGRRSKPAGCCPTRECT
jgi:hypothetical protein